MDNVSSLIKKELTTDEKAAVLLASLEPKLAASIIQHLEPKVMMRVTNALRKLGVVPGALRDRTIAECLRGIQELGLAVQGNESLASSLLVQAIGEKKASALLSENTDTARRSFAELAEMSAEQIAEILRHEQPSIVSLVARHLPPALAAETLAQLPNDIRKQAIVHMCVASDPAEDIVKRIETLLNSRVATVKRVTKKTSDADKVAVITSIMQHAKGAMTEEMLNAIQERSAPLADAIRDRLFVFEDIVKLSDSAVRRLMQEVDSSALAVALRNANMSLRQKFFQNMSKRAAQALKEEIEFSQKMRRSDIEARQKEIVSVLRTLEADGQISTTAADEYI